MTDIEDRTGADERVETAVRAAEAGGEVALDSFRESIAYETKSDKNDFVTRADRDAQSAVIETIREEFPEEAIVGEEEDAPKEVPKTGEAWIVDPIDGTANYVRGLPIWATSVTAVRDGEPVASANVMPALGDRYVASDGHVRRNGEAITVSDREDTETFAVAPTMSWDLDRREEFVATTRAVVVRFGDLRRFGSAHVTLAAVAEGSLEAAISNVETFPWDTVAGVHLIRAAGGTVTDIEGARWHHDSTGIVASNGTAHDAVLGAAREAPDER